MKSFCTILFLVIIFNAKTIWSQQSDNQVILAKAIESEISKNNNHNRLTSQLDYTLLIKNGESVEDWEYITSSFTKYGAYKAKFRDFPSFLHIKIDAVYWEEWGFLWDCYFDFTLTADLNASPGNYKPKVIFDFYSTIYSTTIQETDTVELNVTVYNQPPDKPQLISPVNNAINQHKNIGLKWTEMFSAKSYVVQLSNDQYFASVLKADTTSLDTTQIQGLDAEKKYYWRVQANNSAGSSPWSDTWNFTTGLEWEKTNTPSSHEIKCFAWNGKDLFAGTDGGGILHSTDDGMNWTAINNGLTDLKVLSLFVDGNNIFAGTDYKGIFISTNNGSSWTLLKSGIYVYAFAKIGNYLFVGTHNGIYFSKDDGKNWTDVTSTSLGGRVNDFATLGTNLFAGLYYAIILSTDFGTSWSRLNNNYIECLAVLDSKIFAGCTYNQGIIRSNDMGLSWTSVNNGLNDLYSFDLIASGSNLFSLYSTDILLSTNYGDNWTSVDLEFTNSYRRILGVNLNYLFVGTSNDGIWRRRLKEMTNVNSPAKPLLLSPSASQTILTDTVTFQWKRVKDATLYSIQLSNDQLFTTIINTDSTTTDTTKTITGLIGNLKYYWRLKAKNEAGESLWSDSRNFNFSPVGVENTNEIPFEFSLSQNYPNPFNPSTTINFSLPISAYVVLKIYNTIGQEVAKLVSQELNPGTYSTEWNASDFASGIYFYRITAGDFIETKKLLLIK